MCSGLRKGNLCSVGPDMEKKNGVSSKNCTQLLELSAADDVSGFAVEVEEKGFDVNELSFWYGRRIGSSSKRKMGLEERTPLAISAMFGSVKVLKYILGTGKVDVNAVCGSDGVTPLHCAVAGGSEMSVEAVKLLLSASAAVNALDANGNKPGDYIASCHKMSANSRRRELSFLLNGSVVEEEDDGAKPAGVAPCERKEYPVDTSLPDINTGIYGSDEFRMYSFKVKPCSRAYSHDWTECPFVHPGENARRRDPTKYTYTCVPCPEFKKGSCGKGDGCEFAHGVFESWLHPAQYKTRLCKDETGCLRKVCFFAHKPEELRPLYASTGSALPSPKSPSVSCSIDMGSPMSPMVNCSSPMSGGGAAWPNFVPPALQFSGSRLKTTLNARDFDQQLMEEMVGLSSPSRWNNLKPANLDDLFGSLDSPLGLSPLQSPTGLQMRLQQQHRGTGGGGYTSSRAHAFGYDSSAAVAAAVMNSRSASFGKQRSQSFIDRGRVAAANHRSTNSPPLMVSSMSSSLSSDWGSPDGKPEWGFNDVTNKLTKSASFAVRHGSASSSPKKRVPAPRANEPDVSWVNSLVKDVPSWMDQMYIEQEQAVA